MDVSPIQRMAMTASSAVRPAEPAKDAPAVGPTPQAHSASADQEAMAARAQARMHVEVSWHPSSLGYVTRVVDQHTGEILIQTPPEQVLIMVQKVIERLEGGNG